jgi:hypothetical protein
MSSEYAKSQYQKMISEAQLSGVIYSMLVLASVFVLARSAVHVYRRRRPEAQDYLLYAAFVLFLIMTICYLVILPKLFMISSVSVGAVQRGPTFQDDMITYVRMMFVTTTLFWVSLWSIKLSFLSLYKKLLQGLPIVYMRLWIAVLAFCVIVSFTGSEFCAIAYFILQTLIGYIVSYTTACPDFGAAMSRGDCPLGPRTTRGSLASLYMAYAVDMLSDLMSTFAIMIPPNVRLSNCGSYGSTYTTSLESPDGARTKDSGDCVICVGLCMHGFRHFACGTDWYQVGKQHRPESNMAGSLDYSGEFYRHLHWLLPSFCYTVSKIPRTTRLVRHERLCPTQRKPIRYQRQPMRDNQDEFSQYWCWS